MRKRDKREWARKGLLGTFAAIIAIPIALTLHELGHAIATILTGNRVRGIYLDFINITGYVTITITKWTPRTMKIIILGAYVLPMLVFGAVLYWAYQTESVLLAILSMMGLFVTLRWLITYGG